MVRSLIELHDGLGIHKLLDAEAPVLASITRILDSPERHISRLSEPKVVDEYHACIKEFSCQVYGSVFSFGEDTSAEAESVFIGNAHNAFIIFSTDERRDRSKQLVDKTGWSERTSLSTIAIRFSPRIISPVIYLYCTCSCVKSDPLILRERVLRNSFPIDLGTG